MGKHIMGTPTAKTTQPPLPAPPLPRNHTRQQQGMDTLQTTTVTEWTYTPNSELWAQYTEQRYNLNDIFKRTIKLN